MGRSFAMMRARMWDDPEFRRLSRDAQCTYVEIRMQETVTQCGVTPLQVMWWSKAQVDLTPDIIRRDLAELALCGFVVVDYDTEELLLRRFIATDEVYRKPNSFTAAARAAVSVRSEEIKGALCVEVRNLISGLVEPAVSPDTIDIATRLIGQLDRFAIPSLTHREAFPDTMPKGLRLHAGTPAQAIPGGSGQHAGTPGITSSTVVTPVEDGRQETGNGKLDTPPASAADAALAAEILCLCTDLQTRMIANGCRKPEITASWRDSARLLLTRDSRTSAEAHRLIAWATNDTAFWKRNILSMPTFRKQYDKLRLSREREGAKVTTIDHGRRVDAILAEREQHERLEVTR